MEKKITQPLFIDFEASSLNSDSYPIEVAWSLEDGSIESHLINVHAIKSWRDWDPYAQDIHGISKQKLFEEGKHPKWVAQRMNEVLTDKVLLTNAYEFDLDWCETLFKAADEYMYFNFGDSWHVFGRQLNQQSTPDNVLLEKSVSSQRLYEQLTQISEQAWKKVAGKQHRAGVDVQQLIEMWTIIYLKGE